MEEQQRFTGILLGSHHPAAGNASSRLSILGKFVLEARKADGSESLPEISVWTHVLLTVLCDHGVHDVNPLDTANGHD